MPPDHVDEAAEHLYGVPFEDFVKERDARAKELRQAGEREAAKEVGKLPKPSQVAYAANRLARSGEADELLENGRRLREVQLGGGDRDEVREAATAMREAVEALVRASGLSRAGQDRLRALLQALASDDDLREAFEAGRLVKEPEPGGWPTGEFTAVPRRSPPTLKQAPERPARPSKREQERERRAAERREREAARKREEAERRKWERRLQAARERAEEARQRLEAAQQAYEEATHEVARIEEQLG